MIPRLIFRTFRFPNEFSRLLTANIVWIRVIASSSFAYFSHLHRVRLSNFRARHDVEHEKKCAQVQMKIGIYEIFTARLSCCLAEVVTGQKLPSVRSCNCATTTSFNFPFPLFLLTYSAFSSATSTAFHFVIKQRRRKKKRKKWAGNAFIQSQNIYWRIKKSQ